MRMAIPPQSNLHFQGKLDPVVNGNTVSRNSDRPRSIHQRFHGFREEAMPSQSTSALIHSFLHDPASEKPFLLDLNPTLIYNHSHCQYSTNIPFIELPNRLHELPKPPRDLLILIKARYQSHALTQLRSRGYTVYPLRYPIGERVSGTSTRVLWSPSPLLDNFLRTFNDKFTTALDIGCGSGRDATFLAMHGMSVTAVDRDESLLAKARKLHETDYYDPTWGSTNKAPLVTIARTFGCDRGSDISFLRKHAAELVIVVRFLRRGVLEHLHEAVSRGGYIVFEHFLEGCERFGGPVKKSQMLKRGELQTVFTRERGFTVLRDAEEQLSDGRPVVRFIARRDK